jgi:ribosomal 30S subunit maturation factor RimM
MAIKNEEQRIQELSDKIKKLEAQKQLLEARTKDKLRKERTRRLIQIGAIMDNMGIDNIEIAEKFKNYFINTPKSKEWLDKFIIDEKSKDVQEEKNS